MRRSSSKWIAADGEPTEEVEHESETALPYSRDQSSFSYAEDEAVRVRAPGAHLELSVFSTGREVVPTDDRRDTLPLVGLAVILRLAGEAGGGSAELGRQFG